MLIVCVIFYIFEYMNNVRYNSTIKIRCGCCKMCNDGISKPLIGGLCKFHYWEGRAKSPQRNTKVGKNLWKKTEGNGSELYLWYGARIKERSGFCEECGAIIPFHQSHASIAHLLPKSLFPSVSTNEFNWMELGAGCSCHSRYDLSWHSAQKMKIFPLAKQRVKRFLHLIVSSEEVRRIPECFLT